MSAGGAPRRDPYPDLDDGQPLQNQDAIGGRAIYDTSSDDDEYYLEDGPAPPPSPESVLPIPEDTVQEAEAVAAGPTVLKAKTPTQSNYDAFFPIPAMYSYSHEALFDIFKRYIPGTIYSDQDEPLDVSRTSDCIYLRIEGTAQYILVYKDEGITDWVLEGDTGGIFAKRRQGSGSNLRPRTQLFSMIELQDRPSRVADDYTFYTLGSARMSSKDSVQVLTVKDDVPLRAMFVDLSI